MNTLKTAIRLIAIDDEFSIGDGGHATPEPVESNDFDSALKAFIADSQQKIDQRIMKRWPEGAPVHTKETLELIPGKRFIKVVKRDVNSRSAWAFVDKATGDVYKAASWAAPAKHARANIYDRESWKTVDAYGPAYLR